MGFCLVNNIAVAARATLGQSGLQRVAIVDFDVHHGNGTQDAFYDDSAVLFCSTHAAPLYPGTGAFSEMGSGLAKSTTLNVPLPYYLGDTGYMHVYEQTIILALRRFRPQLLLVSAGYDAHGDDPLGPMSLSTSGYARLTQLLYDAAAELCDGRLVLVLEGGYDLDALGASVVASLRVLLGEGPGPTPHPATYHEPDVGQLVERVKAQHPLLR